MDALAVDAALLRAVLTPEIRLNVGRSLMARVAELEPGGHGTLSLAGVLLEAELPEGLRAGQEIRLLVREVTEQRVVLSLQDAPAPQQPPPAGLVPLPGGGAVHVRRRDESSGQSGGGADAVHTLAIAYDAPNLGTVEMSFTLHPGLLQLGVTLAAGSAFERADAASAELSEALGTAVGRPISVSVHARREPLDVYA